MDQAQSLVQIVPSLVSKKTAMQSNLCTSPVANEGHVIRHLEKEIIFLKSRTAGQTHLAAISPSHTSLFISAEALPYFTKYI